MTPTHTRHHYTHSNLIVAAHAFNDSTLNMDLALSSQFSSQLCVCEWSTATYTRFSLVISPLASRPSSFNIPSHCPYNYWAARTTRTSIQVPVSSSPELLVRSYLCQDFEDPPRVVLRYFRSADGGSACLIGDLFFALSSLKPLSSSWTQVRSILPLFDIYLNGFPLTASSNHVLRSGVHIATKSFSYSGPLLFVLTFVLIGFQVPGLALWSHLPPTTFLQISKKICLRLVVRVLPTTVEVSPPSHVRVPRLSRPTGRGQAVRVRGR